MNTTIDLETYLPFLIPLVIAEFSLAIFSLVHVLKHPTYRIGNKTIWIVVVLLVQFIGPVLYFLIGRGDSE
ncbi:MAG: PLD nuclease N-terminal domain-containing protein [Longicatena sp.]